MLAIAFGLLVSLGLLESVIHWNQNRIAKSDHLDLGLVSHDTSIGWALTPNWRGHHSHHDFEANYRIDSKGFRFQTNETVNSKSPFFPIVGDSFTFGLGVNDDQTFVSRLNSLLTNNWRFQNAAVPGFSTDQELLLVERDIFPLDPKAIILVVYVANDLFDNQLPSPLQVNAPKPYFEVTNDELVIRNSPVPERLEPQKIRKTTLMAAVLGESPSNESYLSRLGNHFEIVRIINEAFIPEKNHASEFEVRFGPALGLFFKIIERLNSGCSDRKIAPILVVLGGKSFIEKPRSLSAQYQEFFRLKILEGCKERNLNAIDLAGLMRERYQRKKEGWFFPNDGHLNPRGHQVVAEILAAELRDDLELFFERD